MPCGQRPFRDSEIVLSLKSVAPFIAVVLPGVAALALILVGGRYPPGHELFLLILPARHCALSPVLALLCTEGRTFIFFRPGIKPVAVALSSQTGASGCSLRYPAPGT